MLSNTINAVRLYWQSRRKSQSPRIGACFRTDNNDSTCRLEPKVSIPSNRGMLSNNVSKGIINSRITSSQSPRIGACFRTEYQVRTTNANRDVSQSPRIGACFRTDVLDGERDTEGLVSIPSNRGMLSNSIWLKRDCVDQLSLNPLESGHAFEPTWRPVTSLSGLLSQSPRIGACFRTDAMPDSHPIATISLNPLESGHAFELTTAPFMVSSIRLVSIPSNRGMLSNQNP